MAPEIRYLAAKNRSWLWTVSAIFHFIVTVVAQDDKKVRTLWTSPDYNRRHESNCGDQLEAGGLDFKHSI